MMNVSLSKVWLTKPVTDPFLGQCDPLCASEKVKLTYIGPSIIIEADGRQIVVPTQRLNAYEAENDIDWTTGEHKSKPDKQKILGSARNAINNR